MTTKDRKCGECEGTGTVVADLSLEEYPCPNCQPNEQEIREAVKRAADEYGEVLADPPDGCCRQARLEAYRKAKEAVTASMDRLDGHRGQAKRLVAMAFDRLERFG